MKTPIYDLYNLNTSRYGPGEAGAWDAGLRPASYGLTERNREPTGPAKRAPWKDSEAVRPHFKQRAPLSRRSDMLLERLEEEQPTPNKDICSRLTNIEKIIYFLAGAILVAIFYRH